MYGMMMIIINKLLIINNNFLGVVVIGKLKKYFKAFYQDDFENEFLQDDRTVIAIDTNYLLSILRLDPEVANKYIDALEKNKERIYIPYFVGLEFSFNKINVKIDQDNKLKDIDNKINKLKNQLDSTSQEISKLTNSNKLDNMKKISNEYIEQFKGLIDDSSTIEENRQENYLKLIDIIDDLLGEKPDQTFIDNIEKEGKLRYEEELPPGFDDSKKDGTRHFGSLTYHQKYGDLLIWREILKHFSSSKNSKRLIYITDDGISNKKNDLFYKYGGRTVGPHIHLIDEANEVANLDLYIIDSKSFVKYSNVSLNKSDESQINNLLNTRYVSNAGYMSVDVRDFEDSTDDNILEDSQSYHIRNKIDLCLDQHYLNSLFTNDLFGNRSSIDEVCTTILNISKKLCMLYKQCNDLDREYLISQYISFMLNIYSSIDDKEDKVLFIKSLKKCLTPLYFVSDLKHKDKLSSLTDYLVEKSYKYYKLKSHDLKE
ncbi:hypothetical protein AKUH3B101J_PKUN00110 (plasmid) [Apilactobacillus kunkeei]|uniref:PIN like domain-containing protein n=2 Tax=Apilactobacillus kunkeei TaxID=148814 RepID=A0A1L8CID3_9LACO|nr:hypothetical protein AKUH3B207X_PKUN00090 [Apilactobacillus kunkeei]CAI2671393.1 hypothetical protein AKUH3B109M_PKUN00110 [Apilactobacillus kunkeei]CAI2671986.1 hypothetical protein AKUH3B104J_PKUN00120 [Apilactobacillus kunkeei]CAI2675034.1 hypothetical protein AKUH3B110M_PKUN00110 [Apilactobacillus kunkeei]CAI2675349.1 hypothetical protein AKUH3B101J_PKUN00110 [Apilactobacillus kunkeei]